MSDEPRRRPSNPVTNRIIEAINRGAYSAKDMMRIEEAIQNQREILRQEVMRQVKQVFGKDAIVVDSPVKSEPPPAQQSPNPFITQKEDEDKITPDPLTDVVIERPDTDQSLTDPMLRRGAHISGLHSSDIG